MFNGIFGALLGVARQTRIDSGIRIAALLIGLVLAILAHMLNNSLGLDHHHSAPELQARVAELGPLLQVLFLEALDRNQHRKPHHLLLPFVMIMLVVLRQSGKWERRVIEEQVGGGGG